MATTKRPAAKEADGHSANASRTVQAGLERLHGAWADPVLRALWLGSAHEPPQGDAGKGGLEPRC